MTVEELCLYANRADASDDAFVASIQPGEITIRDGSPDLAGLAAGLYIRIVGSLYNDGIYQCPVKNLVDETFDGAVFVLRIPAAFIRLAEDIDEWQAANGGVSAGGAYKSESFGGYTYERGTDAVTGGAITWQSIFRREINRWRRV